MTNGLSPEQEGQLLKALIEAKFGKRKNAEFCRLHGINGGPSMLAQHISGHRPIGIDAAIAYSKGLEAPVSAFSPRLAALIESASAVNTGMPPIDTVQRHSEDSSPLAPVIDWAKVQGEIGMDNSQVSALAWHQMPPDVSKKFKWVVAEENMPSLNIKQGRLVGLDPIKNGEMLDDDEIYLFQNEKKRLFLAKYRALADGSFEAIPDSGPPYDSTKHGLVVLASLAYVGTRAFKLPE